MRKLFSNSFFHFGLLIILVVAISLVLKAALVDVVSKFSLSSTDVPQQTESPTSSPEIAGVSTDSVQLALVQRVIDGDTIELSTGEVVRYIGINTPETKHPTKGVECFGQQASLKNEELVLGKVVSLEKDVSETDRYGRLLRYVWLGGKMINQQLVGEGYAYASTYPPDVKYQRLFEEDQQQAIEKNLGLWAECQN